MASRRGNVIKRTRAKGHVFQARYWDHAGKMRSRTFGQKAEAERWLNEMLGRLQRGEMVDPNKGRKTFGVYVDDWLPSLDVRPNTAKQYDWLMKKHIRPAFADVPLRNIEPEDVRNWHANLRKQGKLNKTSQAKAYRLLKRALGVAVDEGYIPANPCRLKGAGTELKYDIEPPSTQTVMALAEAVPGEYQAMVLIAGFGGLRWGEVAALKRKHVDLENGCVNVREQCVEVNNGKLTIGPPKTDAGKRVVYLPQFVMAAVQLHLAQHCATGPEAVLFTPPRPVGRRAKNQGDRYLRRSNFRRVVWIPATQAVGCEGLRFHDLRHAAATLAATTGATIKELMAHIGHASPAAALRYQHATHARRKAIAQGIDALITPEVTQAEIVPLHR